MSSLIQTESGVFVDGEWRVTDLVHPVLDKYSGDPVVMLRMATPEWAVRAVDAADRAARGSRPSPWERAEILSRAGAILGEHTDEIVDSYVAETGFTPVDARNELLRAQRIFELSSQEAIRIHGEEVPVAAYPGSEDRLAFTVREPVGIVGAIAPFNAPLSTVAHKVAPALAAGNAVILKPAEATPLSSIAITSALLAAGLPSQFIQLVTGSGRDIGSVITGDRRIPYFTFTGSTAVGLSIRQSAGLARTHLELGANSAVIVARDADLQQVSDLIVRAGYRKAGQVCTSVQRVLAESGVATELAELLSAKASDLRAGNPRESGVAVGPMINPEAARNALERVRNASESGGKVLTGGELNGSVLAPTVLWGTDTRASLWDEEAFAPIVLVNEVPDVAHAVDIVNGGRYGLQTGVFTQSIDTGLNAAKALQVGGVIINDTSSYHPDNMPYSGIKDSGHGVQGPKYAVDDMTNSKLIVMNLRRGLR